MGAHIYESPTAYGIPFDNSTNGFTAINVQAAIEEARVVISSQITATANATTTSGTNALLTGMTITPAAGTYLVMFSGSMNLNAAGSTGSMSLYVAGAQITHTVRNSSVFDGGALSATSATGAIALQHIATVTGSQVVQIEWSVSSGTATCGPRTLTLLRLS